MQRATSVSYNILRAKVDATFRMKKKAVLLSIYTDMTGMFDCKNTFLQDTNLGITTLKSSESSKLCLRKSS